ncbi:hypothetical protein B9Z55_016703 [Caenorhabditis nigoni]|uniref:Transmembrane protein n=1 Tax=Caenorhabditis nigoni TaxID=1611254 RepID=A0A2G5T674_9PELO|nr:hypothetical protein B9Z55_016703 [Caenorhabditis nigoni]
MVVRTTSKNELARKEPLREKESIVSVASTSTAPPGHLPSTPLASPTSSEDPLLDQHPEWIQNPKATRFLVGLLTSMYVLLLTIVSCLISLSSAWQSPDLWLAETIFSLLMYGIAILFFIYTYFMVIYPKPINALIMFLNKKRPAWVPRPDRWLIPPPLHNGEGAGTLYLRLGALCKLLLQYQYTKMSKFLYSEPLEVSFGVAKSTSASPENAFIVWCLPKTLPLSFSLFSKCISSFATPKSHFIGITILRVLE